MSTSLRTFPERAMYGEGAREKVAETLRARGYKVTMEPLRIRPSRKQWAEYVDHGDLHVDEFGRLEVKRRTYHFTGQSNWPHRDLIVCNYDSYARAEEEGCRPFAYIHLDTDMSHIAVVPGWTKGSWVARGIYDKTYREMRAQWLVSLSQVLWGPYNELEELLLLI